MIVGKLTCPNCESMDFLAGPRGGSSQNIKCSKCGLEMNICPLPGGIWVLDMHEEP